jgi:hypothetical protein
MKKVNMSKLDEPIICPLLSMAAPNQEEFTDCAKEACWLYHRKMKICLIPMGLISLQRIADYLEKLIGKSDLDRKMDSLHRQHGPE